MSDYLPISGSSSGPYKYHMNNKKNARNKSINKGYHNLSFGIPWSKKNLEVSPAFAKLRLELLHNRYAPFSEPQLRALSKKCSQMFKFDFSCPRKNRWLRLIRNNNVSYNHLIALKALSYSEELRSEFKKCFQPPFNSDLLRISHFVHLYKALHEVFAIFTDIAGSSGLNWFKPSRLYLSISVPAGMDITLNDFLGKNCGPLMVTSDLHSARIQASANGMIVVLKPLCEGSDFVPLDISCWLSDYPSEKNWLLFNHCIEVESWIMCSDYDCYFQHFHHLLKNRRHLAKNNNCNGSSITNNNNTIGDIENIAKPAVINFDTTTNASHHHNQNYDEINLNQLNINNYMDINIVPSESKADTDTELEIGLGFGFGFGLGLGLEPQKKCGGNENQDQDQLLDMDVALLLHALKSLITKEEYVSYRGLIEERFVCNFFFEGVSNARKILILKLLLRIAFHRLRQKLKFVDEFPNLACDSFLVDSVNHYTWTYLQSIHVQIDHILKDCHQLRIPHTMCSLLTDCHPEITADNDCKKCLAKYTEKSVVFHHGFSPFK